MTIRILPSLLAADLARLGEEIARAAQSGADGLHLDVMDGHFVPNLSFSPAAAELCRKLLPAGVELNAHLMMTNPDKYAGRFAEAGADTVQFHLELRDGLNVRALAADLHARKARVGLALNPETPAEAALEYSGGNLLDALIYLEEQGVIPRPEDAYYSTKNETPTPPPQELPVLQVKPEAKQAKQKKHKRRGVRHLLHWLRRILLDNELEIWRKGQPITAVPMLILLIFVIFLYWIAIPLLILGLFLGFRYQIAGPDLENDTINGMMDSAASTAADVGRQVMDELKNQHEKYNNRKK